MQLFPSSCYFLSLRSCSQTPSICSSLRTRGQVPHIYKTTGKIFYSLNATFWIENAKTKEEFITTGYVYLDGTEAIAIMSYKCIVTSSQTRSIPGCPFPYEAWSTMTRKVACLFFYTYLRTSSKMTWGLNTVIFIRTVTTVIKPITAVLVADADLVGTFKLIDSTVARLLTCKQIIMLVIMLFAKFLGKLAHDPL